MSQTGFFSTRRGRVRVLFWGIMVLFAMEILYFALS